MSDPVREEKKVLRKAIQQRLSGLSDEEITKQSESVVERLFKLKVVDEAKGFSIYVNMGCEVVTAAVIAGLFSRGKRVFVPCVTGAKHHDMKMVEVSCAKEIESWPLNKWGIRELPRAEAAARPDMLPSVDVVFCPAVAFTPSCHRLGHGRGYYDSFLTRLSDHNSQNGKPPPTAVGLALSEQIIDAVPTSSYDVQLDAVVTPNEVFFKSA
eukprot:TRINITY_DN29050_c0_g1_i1.p1 TRINITY_DN29050_c0_g1~~TRINITY_DN29050_c0_g1_i1.p1  ORF type:complete len:211 (+),score=49.09 TRINITY_DN29050_c0_g1_i1:55-687(+)